MNPIESAQLFINNILGGWIHNGSSASSDLLVTLHLL